MAYIDNAVISHSSAHPSFSSSLLDSIYRSIDRGDERLGGTANDLSVRRTDNKKVETLPMDNARRLRNSRSSSSADCTRRGGLFSSSSSEAGTVTVQMPKPVRTVGLGFREEKAKREGGFVKTKSRALKFYGELKKVKQPISPGGRLAGLWNSILTAGNLKKPKLASGDSPTLKSTTSSSCSSTSASASSFSRSCLSKTPSSRAAEKRTVTFFPVSVIIDEDCRPCGHKALQHSNIDKNRYKTESPFHDLIKNLDEDDDDLSCASSDLFELDNLSAIGMDSRYSEELPVYETTHLHRNRAIASGFIL